MNHQIKCPACKTEFAIEIEPPPDMPIKKTKLEMAITICKNCGAPLVNINNTDNWEILRPDHLSQVPEELREKINALMADGLVATLKKMLDDSEDKPEPELPRGYFFMNGNEAVAKDAVVFLAGKRETDSFVKITKVFTRPDMQEALMESSKAGQDQNTKEN